MNFIKSLMQRAVHREKEGQKSLTDLVQILADGREKELIVEEVEQVLQRAGATPGDLANAVEVEKTRRTDLALASHETRLQAELREQRKGFDARAARLELELVNLRRDGTAELDEMAAKIAQTERNLETALQARMRLVQSHPTYRELHSVDQQRNATTAVRRIAELEREERKLVAAQSALRAAIDEVSGGGLGAEIMKTVGLAEKLSPIKAEELRRLQKELKPYEDRLSVVRDEISRHRETLRERASDVQDAEKEALSKAPASLVAS